MLPLVNYSVGVSPIGLIAGDFNGDGKLDLAVANSGSDTVSILLGKGDGTFIVPAANYSTGPAGSAPWAVTVVDVNRDGIPDLAVANSGNNTMAVLAGNGDGTFRTAQAYPVNNTPRDVVALDLNRDGVADVVTANEGGLTNVVSVTSAQVVSNFATLTASTTINNPYANTVTVSGMTPDSFYNGTYPTGGVSGTQFSYSLTHADAGPSPETGTAVISNGGDLSVLMGVSPGPLSPNYQLTNLPAGQTPFGVAVGDFNRDGKPDIVAADANFNSISTCGTGTSPCNDLSVILNAGTVNGITSFGAASSLAVGTFTRAVAVGDFNGDGKPDLVATSGLFGAAGSSAVEVLLGNGDGTFQAATILAADVNPRGVAVGDFNHDGKLDLAILDQNTNDVSFLFGNGNGTFQAAVNFPAGTSPTALAAGDFNGDGITDLAVADSGSQNVSILFGTIAPVTGVYSLATPVLYSIAPSSGSIAITVGDFNRDGALDIAVANQGSNDVSVLLGNKTTTFPILPDGTFQPAVSYPAGNQPFAITAVDYNRDGVPDLAVASNGDNAVSLLQGNGDGSFRPPMKISVEANGGPSGITFADLNGDGVADIITANQATNDVSVLMSGKRNAVANTVGACTNPIASVIADFNNDTNNDMAVLNAGCNNVSIFLGDGKGDLAPATPATVAVGTNPSALAAGNFITGKANVDLVVANKGDNTVSVLIGNGDGTFTPKLPAIAVGSGPTAVFVSDINGDGKADVAVVNGGDNTVTVLFGNGDGTFSPQPPISGANPGLRNTSQFGGPSAIVMGDLNGDGFKDMVVANSATNSISVLLNDKTGHFPTA